MKPAQSLIKVDGKSEVSFAPELKQISPEVTYSPIINPPFNIDLSSAQTQQKYGLQHEP